MISFLSGTHSTTAGRKPTLRFAGEKEYQEYLRQLQTFQPDSIERLADILRNGAQSGMNHVRVARELGKQDPEIQVLYEEIDRLMQERARNRQSNPALSEQAQEHLGDLRKAIAEVMAAHGYDTRGNRLDTQA